MARNDNNVIDVKEFLSDGDRNARENNESRERTARG